MIDRLGKSCGVAVIAAMAAIPIGVSAQDKPNYSAAWIAIAEAPHELHVAEGRWAAVARFRPERLFTLDGAATDARGKVLLMAGTRMIGMAGRAGLACQLERAPHDYFVGCVEDKDGDGRFETYFDLNHANPFLFSAFRQPRAKDRAIGPVSLAPATAGDVSASMVLFYRNRAELTGRSRFELCVLHPDNRNPWGDKTVGRGCLPPIDIGDGEFPREVSAYGRTLRFLSRDAEGARVVVAGAPADMPVRL
jgi:hypothetical protein